MAHDNPPQKPKERSERREQANRIADISHRIADMGNTISVAIRALGDQIFSLTHQIQADNQTNDTREKEYQDRSFRQVKWGTRSSIVISVFSVITSVVSLYILYLQLSTMRIEQRAWITIETTGIQFEQGKPLTAQIVVKNTGKTPAERVNSNFIVRTVKHDDSSDIKISGILFNIFAGILNPNETFPVPAPMLKDKADLFNPPVLTHADVDEITSGKAYIMVLGRVEYFDVYGGSHWIDYCRWKSLSVGNFSALRIFMS